MAQAHGMSLFNYQLAEYDKPRGEPENFDLYGYLHMDGETEITPQDHEKCLIYRRRSKKTQSQIAKEFGCGRYWLRLQEKGKVSCAKLLAWWEEK